MFPIVISAFVIVMLKKFLPTLLKMIIVMAGLIWSSKSNFLDNIPSMFYQMLY